MCCVNEWAVITHSYYWWNSESTGACIQLLVFACFCYSFRSLFWRFGYGAGSNFHCVVSFFNLCYLSWPVMVLPNDLAWFSLFWLAFSLFWLCKNNTTSTCDHWMSEWHEISGWPVMSEWMIGDEWMNACPCGFAVPSVIWAVSYTHLRAHETLRHLVCRLLLEKKK